MSVNRIHQIKGHILPENKHSEYVVTVPEEIFHQTCITGARGSGVCDSTFIHAKKPYELDVALRKLDMYDFKIAISQGREDSSSPLTTHVLNTALGVAGSNMALSLYRQDASTKAWILIASGTTNDDGRCPGLITKQMFTSGVYKIHFESAQYWESLGETYFHPYIEIAFTIKDPGQKYHIPLLLSHFSFSTYRGS